MNCQQIAEKAVNEWFAYQDALELEFGLRVVQNFRPKIIVELGIAHGASLAAWCEAAHPEVAIGIDPLDLQKTSIQKQSLEQLIDTYHINIVQGTTRSPQAQERMQFYLKERPIDFLFIDAEHKYDDVRHDFYEYKKYLSPHALVGFHDIYYSEQSFDGGQQVYALWERLKKQYKHDEIHHHSSMGMGFIYL